VEVKYVQEMRRFGLPLLGVGGLAVVAAVSAVAIVAVAGTVGSCPLASIDVYGSYERDFAGPGQCVYEAGTVSYLESRSELDPAAAEWSRWLRDNRADDDGELRIPASQALFGPGVVLQPLVGVIGIGGVASSLVGLALRRRSPA
jgi:hypothetical protein